MDEYIQAIMNASTGANIRVPLVNALRFIFEKGKDVEFLNGQTSDFYARQSVMATMLPFDTWSKRPDISNTKLVAGSVIFGFTGDLDMLPTIVEEIVDYGK